MTFAEHLHTPTTLHRHLNFQKNTSHVTTNKTIAQSYEYKTLFYSKSFRGIYDPEEEMEEELHIYTHV